MSNKPLPPSPKSPKDVRSINDQSSLKDEKLSTSDNKQEMATSNHPHLTSVKGILSDAVHNAAQALKIEPKESHPEAHHQDVSIRHQQTHNQLELLNWRQNLSKERQNFLQDIVKPNVLEQGHEKIQSDEKKQDVEKDNVKSKSGRKLEKGVSQKEGIKINEESRKKQKKEQQREKTQPVQKTQQKQKHDNLESFLSIKDFNTESYVYKGTLYEYETMSCLQKHFGIITRRSGGANDDGIDFRGKWVLPNEKKLYIIGQCKNSSSKCSPNSIRELEGVLGTETCDTLDTLGILSSKSGFSRRTIKRFITSPHPLILIRVIHNGKRCESFIWNKSCKKFLDGLEVTLRFANAGDEFDVSDDIMEHKPILLYNGKPFIPNCQEQYWDSTNDDEKINK